MFRLFLFYFVAILGCSFFLNPNCPLPKNSVQSYTMERKTDSTFTSTPSQITRLNYITFNIQNILIYASLSFIWFAENVMSAEVNIDDRFYKVQQRNCAYMSIRYYLCHDYFIIEL
ncbi:hypothetical protein ACP275_04G159300 [Erythranthe tilingii]